MSDPHWKPVESRKHVFIAHQNTSEAYWKQTEKMMKIVAEIGSPDGRWYHQNLNTIGMGLEWKQQWSALSPITAARIGSNLASVYLFVASDVFFWSFYVLIVLRFFMKSIY